MRVRTLLGPLVLVVAGAVILVRRRSRPGPEPLWEPPPAGPRTMAVPPVPVPVVRSGTRAQRGTGTLRMDLERARAHEVEPVVQFLTYLQERRGDRSHLLFVRSDDLDAMAEAADESVDEFLARLDQLGVIVSNN